MVKLADNDKYKIENAAAMFIFGTIGIFVRYIPLPSSTIAASRALIGTIFLLLLIFSRGMHISFSDIKRNLVTLCLSGVFLGANWIFLFEAYRYTTVSTATLCYYLAPVFITIASPLVLKERLTLEKGLCVLAALIGMVLVSGVFRTESTSSFQIIGILFGVGAAVLYACIVLMNKTLKAVSAFDRTIMQLGISAIVLLPYTLLTESITEMILSPTTAVLLATVGVLHTGIAYALYFGSIGNLKAQTVAIFSYIDPVVAILLSALLLKESLGLFGIIGAVLVLGSTFLSELLENCKTPAAQISDEQANEQYDK